MLALGIVLVLLAGLVGGSIIFSNSESIQATILWLTVENVSLGGIFLAGALTGLAFALGMFLLLGGTIRSRHKRASSREEHATSTSEPYPTTSGAKGTRTRS